MWRVSCLLTNANKWLRCQLKASRGSFKHNFTGCFSILIQGYFFILNYFFRFPLLFVFTFGEFPREIFALYGDTQARNWKCELIPRTHFILSLILNKFGIIMVVVLKPLDIWYFLLIIKMPDSLATKLESILVLFNRVEWIYYCMY